MSNERFGFQGSQQRQKRLDADAMCTQCGTVNPEGTLICRTCGNNLRDQRAIRAEADRILHDDVAGASWVQRHIMLIGLLITGAVLLIAALNAGPLLDSIMSSTAPPGTALWRGGDAKLFNAMLAELNAVQWTDEQKLGALTLGGPGFTDEGMFVLAQPDTGGGMKPIGDALGRWDSDGARYLFVARVGEGEIRGIARRPGANLEVEVGGAALQYQGQYYNVMGAISRDEAGRFVCVGGCDLQLEGQNNRRLYAYPLK